MQRALLFSLGLAAFASASAQPQDPTPPSTPKDASKPAKPAPKSKSKPAITALESISVTGDDDDPNKAKKGTASALAPSQASLSELEPQSILNSNYIRTIASPKADYLSLMELTPSSSNSSPNGAGLSSKNATIRGFQDGEYDVSFDGIPFGDPGSFSHATTAFFPAPSLGEVVVDRGPGTSSNLGNATFGGTVALYSEPLTDQPSGRVSTMYGSGDTWQEAAAANTGTLNRSGTQASINYSHLETNGLLDNAGLRQDNLMVKVKQPLGSHTTLTLVADYNHVVWNTFTQMTRALTDAYGLNYAGLNNDPTSQSYAPYNVDDRHADFEYLQLHSEFGSWRIDNKMYTYGLRDTGTGGIDLRGGTPNASLLPNGGVPGAIDASKYRVWGDMFRAEKDLGSGWTDSTLRTGFWAERTYEGEHEATVDLSSMAPEVFKGDPTSELIDTTAHSSNVNSYAELEWRPTDKLTLVPGFKHIDFERTLEGSSEFLPVSGSGHFSTNLGAFSANYRFTPELAGYAQWAMGYQAPKVGVLQGDSSQVQPQQTRNYQAGLVWKTPSTVADLDVYYIDFTNMVNSQQEPIGPGGSLVDVYFNQGGVIYKGIEGELTQLLGDSGLSFTANGSVNSAYVKSTGLQIANAPRSTADVGFIYNNGHLYGSLLTKYVGHRYAGTGQSVDRNPANKLPAYNYTNLNIGYNFTEQLRLQLSANNLFDHRTITEGNGSSTTTTFYHLIGRNYSAQLTYTF